MWITLEFKSENAIIRLNRYVKYHRQVRHYGRFLAEKIWVMRITLDAKQNHIPIFIRTQLEKHEFHCNHVFMQREHWCSHVSKKGRILENKARVDQKRPFRRIPWLGSGDIIIGRTNGHEDCIRIDIKYLSWGWVIVGISKEVMESGFIKGREVIFLEVFDGWLVLSGSLDVDNLWSAIIQLVDKLVWQCEWPLTREVENDSSQLGCFDGPNLILFERNTKYTRMVFEEVSVLQSNSKTIITWWFDHLRISTFVDRFVVSRVELKCEERFVILNRLELGRPEGGEEIEVMFRGIIRETGYNTELGETGPVHHLRRWWLKIVAVYDGALDSKLPEMFQLLVDVIDEWCITILNGHFCWQRTNGCEEVVGQEYRRNGRLL